MGAASRTRLGLLALLWGSSFLLISVALEGLSPLAIVAVRMVLGAGALLAVLAVRGERLPVGVRVWGHLGVAALVGNVVPYLLFAWGQQTVPSHVAGALNATTPLFTLGIAVAGHQEHARPVRLAGLAVGFAGAVTVLAPWRQAGLAGPLTGEMACLAAAASYALAYVYTSRHLIGRGVSALVLAAAQLLAGSVLLAPLAPWLAADGAGLTPAVVVSVSVLGVLQTGLAYILNYRLIQDEGATAASTVTYLLPVVAVALGVLALGEPLTWNLLAGTAGVLLGVAAAEGRMRAPARRRRVSDEPAHSSQIGQIEPSLTAADRAVTHDHGPRPAL